MTTHRTARYNIETILQSVSDDFFKTLNLSPRKKKQIFLAIAHGIQKHAGYLECLILREAKLTTDDAKKEVERAYQTFCTAAQHSAYRATRKFMRGKRVITETRLPRGPLLAITPFSSPISSPAHKIAAGILAGASLLFKPSPHTKRTGEYFFNIIRKATRGHYVYFYAGDSAADLRRMVSDERIGIISFTGGYETGKKIIQSGGVKKYHMELSGGNSPVLFAPDYRAYTDMLLKTLVNGIMQKNGERCTSIKHIFIPKKYAWFIEKLRTAFFNIHQNINDQREGAKTTILGPLITEAYARKTETTVRRILNSARYVPLVPFVRQGNYIFPTLYAAEHITKENIRKNLTYDIPGPVVFIYTYQSHAEYRNICSVLKNDYIHSGLQLSIYTRDRNSLKSMFQNLLWGGIIINDIPTFRDEYMSFGGFGRSGLGKEGFFETITACTDPQTIVYKKIP